MSGIHCGAAWKGTLFTDPFPLASAGALLPALLLSAIKGPVEEFGWRGFAQPLLQRRLAPFWAALIIGIVWEFWHLPAFLLSGTQQSAWSFAPFFAGTIAISIIMARLFNASRGSILLAAFMHFQLMNPLWPDAQPYDKYILVVIAALVAGCNHKAMFNRKGSVTQIISHSGYTAVSCHEIRSPVYRDNSAGEALVRIAVLFRPMITAYYRNKPQNKDRM